MIWFSNLLVDTSFLLPIIAALNAVWIYVVGLIGTAGSIYAIILAVNMAKADTADKREMAKKRIIAVLTTMICLIVLIIGLKFFLEMIPQWAGDPNYAPSAMIGLLAK